MYEDGGKIDYSEGWNQDYENDPLVKAKRKAKETAIRAGLAYATGGGSEIARAEGQAMQQAMASMQSQQQQAQGQTTTQSALPEGEINPQLAQQMIAQNPQLIQMLTKSGGGFQGMAKGGSIESEIDYSKGGIKTSDELNKAFESLGDSNTKLSERFKRGGTTPKKQRKIAKVMREFKQGELHSGSKDGPIVKDREQAIAIALSEAGASKKMATGGGIENVNKWEKGDITVVNGEYLKRAEVVPSYKDDTMRGNYFVVFRNENKKIIESKDNFKEYNEALKYAMENVNKYATGGGIDKNSKTNIPSTEDLIKLVSIEREKKIKEWKKFEKVVIGRNDGYSWEDGSTNDNREIATKPSRAKVIEIIKNNPNVTEIHFYGTIKAGEKVGEYLEIVDDFDVLLWSKEDNLFKKGFQFRTENGKYLNTIIDKSETIEYKNRKDSGEFLYYKSIDKYGNAGEGRIHKEVLQEDLDNGAAFIVSKMASGGSVIETFVNEMVKNQIARRTLRIKDEEKFNKFMQDIKPFVDKKIVRVKRNPIDKEEVWISLQSLKS
jgi:hypothetical protein